MVPGGIWSQVLYCPSSIALHTVASLRGYSQIFLAVGQPRIAEMASRALRPLGAARSCGEMAGVHKSPIVQLLWKVRRNGGTWSTLYSMCVCVMFVCGFGFRVSGWCEECRCPIHKWSVGCRLFFRTVMTKPITLVAVLLYCCGCSRCLGPAAVDKLPWLGFSAVRFGVVPPYF